jgi:predicted TIM-barrel fold metal-dependent hydrolase
VSWQGGGGCKPVPLDQLYFDLACDAYPRGVKILLTLTDTKHIMYGTDYPAIPEPVLMRHMGNTINCVEFADCVEDILHNNAERLFVL